MRLASRFGRINQIRRDRPLTHEELMQVVPSVFGEGKHVSRSTVCRCCMHCSAAFSTHGLILLYGGLFQIAPWLTHSELSASSASVSQ